MPNGPAGRGKGHRAAHPGRRREEAVVAHFRSRRRSATAVEQRESRLAERSLGRPARRNNGSLAGHGLVGRPSNERILRLGTARAPTPTGRLGRRRRGSGLSRRGGGRSNGRRRPIVRRGSRSNPASWREGPVVVLPKSRAERVRRCARSGRRGAARRRGRRGAGRRVGRRRGRAGEGERGVVPSPAGTATPVGGARENLVPREAPSTREARIRFTLATGGGAGEPEAVVYTSEVATDTLNPDWEPLDDADLERRVRRVVGAASSSSHECADLNNTDDATADATDHRGVRTTDLKLTVWHVENPARGGTERRVFTTRLALDDLTRMHPNATASSTRLSVFGPWTDLPTRTGSNQRRSEARPSHPRPSRSRLTRPWSGSCRAARDGALEAAWAGTTRDTAGVAG